MEETSERLSSACAERAAIEALLDANLRSTQPTPPMVSRLDALSQPCAETLPALQREEDIKTLMQRNHHLEKELAELKRKMSSQPSMTEAPIQNTKATQNTNDEEEEKKRRRKRRRRKRMRWRRGRRNGGGGGGGLQQ
ncbi:hypothetical protein WMY93_029810 [Mugilogobius chulae]|uniref:Uncharacterized protein n=1 Tax=Mugilogobius chulae TaxID=88201 RepID=A0AAW0MQD6_9GOBI